MKAGLLIGTTMMTLVANCVLAVAGEVAREPLDRLWEKHMLNGTSASYRNGQPNEGPPQFIQPLQAVHGDWVWAMRTARGIKVSDSRGTRLLGLLRGGGWVLAGGLLDRASNDRGAVELYVKHVAPVHPGLLDHHAPMKQEAYEFFLLDRPHDAPQATIIKKWVISPEEVRWYVPDHFLQGPLRIDDKAILHASETSDVRGFLAYDPATKIATVTIMGLNHPLEERVDLSAALAK